MNEYEKQSVFDIILEKIVLKSRNVQAYILVGNDIEYLKNKALQLSKAFICPSKFKKECTNCNICKRIDDGNFGELKIINPINRTIKKDSVVNIKNSFQTNSIEAKNQVYIINEVELLNQSAANSILKFLEEPDSNTIAIFTTTNLDAVMNTISSRCQVIRLSGEKKQNNSELVFEFCKLNDNEYDIALKYFTIIEKDTDDAIINFKEKFLNSFNSKESMISVLKLFLLIYKDMLNYKVLGYFDIFKDYTEISNVADLQDVEKIIKKIVYILENINKMEYNVNISLFMNNLIIGIGEISDGKCSRS